MDRSEALRLLPPAHARALELAAQGAAKEELAARLDIETCAVGPLLRIAHAKLAALEATDRASAPIHEDPSPMPHTITPKASQRKKATLETKPVSIGAPYRDRTMGHPTPTIRRPHSYPQPSPTSARGVSAARTWLRQRLAWERHLTELWANYERAAGPTDSSTSSPVEP